jgi:hypothetical protein
MTYDEFLDYVKEKRISPHRLARVSGYSRTHVRNCIFGESFPTPECLSVLVEAALEIGEQTTFSKVEMEILRDLSLPMRHLSKPSSMSDREWKEFMEKLL